MKNNKALIIICVILLNILVVFMISQAFYGKESDSERLLRLARTCTEQNLCRKALGYYNEALTYEDSLDVRIEMIQVYEKAVETGEFQSINNVFTNVQEIVELYPGEVKAYEAVCGFMEKYEQIETCVELLMQAEDRKLVSQTLADLRERVRYIYKLSYTMYSNVSSEYSGSYLVQIDDVYSLLTSGLGNIAGGFSYASSFSEGYAFVRIGDENEEFMSCIIDRAGIRQCYLENVTESSGVGLGANTEGEAILLLACKVDGKYTYYDLTGKPVFGDYLFAGRFRNNVAAVKESENSWKLINALGEPIVDTVFEDVILNEFDECAPKGRIFAKTEGKYYLYDMTGTRIGDFSCDDARPYIENVTAFKVDGKWGFVDTEGNVLIQPKYDDAKAFSKGIAGVQQEGVWTFVDSGGEIVIQGDYEDVGYMGSNGLCFVKMDGRWAVLQMYYIAD